MIVVGLARTVAGRPARRLERRVRRAGRDAHARPRSSCCVLRAFSSGCSALTGVEAVSNGVPAFRKPKVRNAQTTLVLMGAHRDRAVRRPHGARPHLAACTTPRTPATSSASTARTQPQPSLMAQVAAATFGMGSIPFYVIQAATALRAAARGQHGVQRLPAARLGARPRRLRAQGAEHPRRPPRLLERHDHPRRSPRSSC